jgi:6-phosphogluconolactonase (cycloisomerase 2 family)
MRIPMPVRALCLAATLVLLFLLPHVAHAAVGDVGYLGGTPASGAPVAVAISPDGKSLYAADFVGSSVSTFQRAADGELTYEGCISGKSGSGECTAIPSATASASASGLFFPTDLLVSPDGSQVYVLAAGDTSIAHFSRDTASGALTYVGCITGAVGNGPGGSGACAQLPKATEGGDGSGLGGIYALAISPDGRSLYTGAPFDAAVSSFSLDPVSGDPSFQGCITGKAPLGPLGDEVCRTIATATGSGSSSGLDHAIPVAVSPDGESVYVGASVDSAVDRFARDPATGRLDFVNCLTSKPQLGPSGSGACTEVEGASAGEASGLYGAASIAVSPDGTSVYTASMLGSVASFSRTPAGALSYEGCVTGSEQLGPGGSGACALSPHATGDGSGSGLGYVDGVVVSPDGASVYVLAHGEATVTTFARGSDGTLVDAGCISGSAALGAGGNGACATIPSATSDGWGSGLNALFNPTPRALAMSPDGGSLYLGASSDEAIARFARELPPIPQPEPEPQPPVPAKQCKVPNLAGKKLGAAKRKIRAAGCRVGKVTRRAGSTAKRGRVVAQGPKAGREVAAGTAVRLTLVRG